MSKELAGFIMIPMRLFDVHTHLFPPDVIRDRALIAEKDPVFSLLYGPPAASMVDAAHLSDYLNREGIDRAVAVSFPFRDPGLVRLSNDCLLDAADKDSRLVPLVMVDQWKGTGAIQELERCIERGAAGLGEVAFYQGFSRSEREHLDRLVVPLEEADRVLMLHVNEQIGHTYSGKAPMNLEEVTAFVEAHPRLTIILSHLGGGLCFYEFMPEIKKAFARVFYDIAALPFLYGKEIYGFLACHLSKKVLFGSDYPLLPASRYLPGLADLDDRFQDRLLFDNAEEIFGRIGMG